jgi:hypothetical protein
MMNPQTKQLLTVQVKKLREQLKMEKEAYDEMCVSAERREAELNDLAAMIEAVEEDLAR